MKKFVSGIIVGALLFSSVSAFADSVGIIGKKVTGTYTVIKDGKKIAEAAIINGSAYAPVRAVSEATGTGLSVEGKTIIMESVTPAASADETTIQLNALKLKRTLLLKDLQAAEGSVKMYETTYLPNAEQYYSNHVGTESEGQYKKWLEDRKAEYEQRKAEFADLQQQLAELDAQIAALQK